MKSLVLLVGLDASVVNTIKACVQKNRNPYLSFIVADTAEQAMAETAEKHMELIIMRDGLRNADGIPLLELLTEKRIDCRILLTVTPLRITSDTLPPQVIGCVDEKRLDTVLTHLLRYMPDNLLIGSIQQSALTADIRDGYRIPEQVSERLFETHKRYEAVLSDYGFSSLRQNRIFLILNRGDHDSLGNEQVRSVGLLMRKHLGDRLVHHIACLSQNNEINWFIQTTRDCTQAEINRIMKDIRTHLENLWGWKLFFIISAPLRHTDDLYLVRNRMRDMLHNVQTSDRQFIRSFSSGHVPVDAAGNLVGFIKSYVDAHIRQNISLLELSHTLNYNQDYLTRIFRNTTGMTIVQYHASKRFALIMSMLRDPMMPISEIARETGFTSINHFSNRLHKALGMSPSAYRKWLIIEGKKHPAEDPAMGLSPPAQLF